MATKTDNKYGKRLPAGAMFATIEELVNYRGDPGEFEVQLGSSLGTGTYSGMSEARWVNLGWLLRTEQDAYVRLSNAPFRLMVIARRAPSDRPDWNYDNEVRS